MGSAAKRNVGSGSGQIPDMSFWQSGDKWRKTPDGFIEQWGTTIALGPNQTQRVNFPIPFPVAAYGLSLAVVGFSAGTPEYFSLERDGVTIANGLSGTSGNPIFFRVIGK